MMKRKILVVITLLFVSAPAVMAQFNGRPGDLVLFALTVKGRLDFQVVAPTTANSAAALSRFEIKNSATLPFIRIGDDQISPGLFRQSLHEESDDAFQLITWDEGFTAIHRIYTATGRTFVLSGLFRDLGAKLDFTANSYGPALEGVDIGPDLVVETYRFLLWSKVNIYPFFQAWPEGVPGPNVPPGRRGVDLILDQVKLPVFVPWIGLRREYPTARWSSGIDTKLLEQDTTVGVTARIIRLRPGRTTPTFRIPGNTHLYVLQGSGEIAPTGTSASALKPDFYAFVPGNLVIRLSNPKQYDGPGAQ